MLITNVGIALIIGFVYILAFMPFGGLSGGPVFKGNTGSSNVAMQIVVDEKSDVNAYMDMLEDFGAFGTFFFPEPCYQDQDELIQAVLKRGHSVGYYVYKDDDAQFGLYLGGGYSVPVMNYMAGNELIQVCPSIDMTVLENTDEWQKVFSETALDDLFIHVDADNNFEEFEKIVQIVRNKGYTILKVNEML